MWRQVRSERGRERGRDEFNEDMLGNDDFLEFALRWWPPLAATQVFEWLGDGDFLARVADGILSQHEQATLVKSWDGTLSIEDIPLLDDMREDRKSVVEGKRV